uniref:Uncharacterized protein n=1 Tax=Picocystis salinarum TaxID=88271 RepID=A0A6U9Q2A8_9CHLO|mmetsp:Transcript_511/g.3688  ORF Transcript_511/g.3688 Transcript_511/m.3688 type:complete len:547 (-) Transcript_511:5281-6921(-)
MEVARLRAVHVRNALPTSTSDCWNQTSILFVICVRERGEAKQKIVYVSSLKSATLNPDWCVIMHDMRPRYLSNSLVNRPDAEEWILVFSCNGEGKWEILQQLHICKENFSFVGRSLGLMEVPYSPNSVVLELDNGFYVGCRSAKSASNATQGQEHGSSVGHGMVHEIFQRLRERDNNLTTASDIPSTIEQNASLCVDLHVGSKGNLQDITLYHGKEAAKARDAAVARALRVVRRVRALRQIQAQTRELSTQWKSTLEKRKVLLKLSVASAESKNKVVELENTLAERRHWLREANALKQEMESRVCLWASTQPHLKEILDSCIRNLAKAETILVSKGGYERLANIQHMVSLWRSSALSKLGALFRVQSNIVDEFFPSHDLHLHSRAPHEIRLSICGIDLEPMVWHYIFDIYLQWGGEGQERMEKMATALGYAALVAKLTSNYLDVRLQFSLYPIGSHSFLTDRLPRMDQLKAGDSMPDFSPRLYPLYVDHSEKGAFTQAVYLFNRDLHQLLDVYGLGHHAQKQSFSNLHILLSCARKVLSSPPPPES